MHWGSTFVILLPQGSHLHHTPNLPQIIPAPNHSTPSCFMPMFLNLCTFSTMDKNSANSNVPNVIIRRQSVWEIWRSLVWSVVGFTLARRETGAGPRLAGLLAASPPEAPPRAGLRAGPARRAAPGELRPLRVAWGVRNHKTCNWKHAFNMQTLSQAKITASLYCRAI